MADFREPCPDCREVYGHHPACVMYGMDEEMSSLMYGYPVCQCCHLRHSPERTRLHARRDHYRMGLIRG